MRIAVETAELPLRPHRLPLAAAECTYDMLPVNIIVPEDSEQLALTVNGKKRNLHRNDFLKFAENIALPRPAAERMLNMVISMLPSYQIMCENSYLPNDMKALFSALLSARTDSLRQAVISK